MCIKAHLTITGGKAAKIIMFIFQNALNTTEQKKNAKHRLYSEENRELMQSIARAKLELDIANQNFSYATDPLLVDVYTYQIKAAQAKYSYLLQKVKCSDLSHSEYIKRNKGGL